MFHIVFSITARFLYLGDMLQGFARGILALRNLRITSSHLIPALPSPSSAPPLGAPLAFLELPEDIISPYSSALIAIEPQPPVFSSSIPSYQSSLIAITPSQMPNLVPLFIFLATISGFVIILPEFVYFFNTIAKNTSAFAYASRIFAKSFKSRPILYLAPTSPPIQLRSSNLLIPLVPFLASY
jgi:hypothetical protein